MDNQSQEPRHLDEADELEKGSQSGSEWDEESTDASDEGSYVWTASVELKHMEPSRSGGEGDNGIGIISPLQLNSLRIEEDLNGDDERQGIESASLYFDAQDISVSGKLDHSSESSETIEFDSLVPMELFGQKSYGIASLKKDAGISAKLDNSPQQTARSLEFRNPFWERSHVPTGPLKDFGCYVEMNDIIPPPKKSSFSTKPGPSRLAYIPKNVVWADQIDTITSANLDENANIDMNEGSAAVPAFSPANTEPNVLNTDNSTDYELPPYLRLFRSGIHFPKFNNFQKMFDLIGPSGFFHKRSLFCTLLPAAIVHPFITLDILFMLFTQSHWCASPRYDKNGPYIESKGDHVPMNITNGTEVFESCLMYDGTKTLVSCEFGWAYNKSQYGKTIPSEFDYVCDHKDIPGNVFSGFIIARLIGSLLFGQVADILGRKRTFFLLVFMNAVARTLVMKLAGRETVLQIAVFCIGLSHPCLLILPLIYMMETSEFAFRTKYVVWTCSVWLLGYISLAITTFLTNDWYLLCLTNSLMSYWLCSMFMTWYESPRWLFLQGYIRSCASAIMSIAWENLTHNLLTKGLVVDMLRDMRGRLYGAYPPSKRVIPKFLFYRLFTQWCIAKISILSCFIWFCCGCLHQIAAINRDRMSDNRFYNIMLTTLMYLPSVWLGGYLAKRGLRRRTLVVSFAACAWFSILLILCSEIDLPRNLFCVLILQFNAVATLVMGIQTVEMFPTECRATGCGVSLFFWLLCEAVVPLYGELLTKSEIPYIVTLILAVVGTFGSSVLPETYKAILPDTIEQLKWRRYNCFWANACKRGCNFQRKIQGMNNPSYQNEVLVEEDYV